MAFATEAKVREIGGLNDQSQTGDWHLFRFVSNSELSTAIANAIAVAGAWIQTHLLDPTIYSTSDPNLSLLLAQGESYLALHFLVPAVKARRVMGSHYAVESEASDRYEELIDVEWLQLAQELLQGLLILEITTEQHFFARPTLRVGPVLDPLQIGVETVEQELEETLDRARSLSVVLP